MYQSLSGVSYAFCATGVCACQTIREAPDSELGITYHWHRPPPTSVPDAAQATHAEACE
jgi:hypothetical protein